MSHWHERYIGLPYVEDEFDCTHLLQKVTEEVFGKVIPLPSERQPTAFGKSGQVGQHKNHYFEKITPEEAVDGDVVIMVCRTRFNHIGVFFRLNGVPYVLHNLKNVGGVTAHRIRDLDRINIGLDGYYRFKEGLEDLHK